MFRTIQNSGLRPSFESPKRLALTSRCSDRAAVGSRRSPCQGSAYGFAYGRFAARPSHSERGDWSGVSAAFPLTGAAHRSALPASGTATFQVGEIDWARTYFFPDTP
jgi:hypothetical protein